MNLIEAMKSGRPFRRIGSDYWISKNTYVDWTTEEILADNWEIDPEAFQLTEADIKAIIYQADAELYIDKTKLNYDSNCEHITILVTKVIELLRNRKETDNV